MTEAEWLACAEPTRMIAYLRGKRVASARKLRLFACACCRRLWTWLEEPCRRAVEAAERHADGQATRPTFALAGRSAGSTRSVPHPGRGRQVPARLQSGGHDRPRGGASRWHPALYPARLHTLVPGVGPAGSAAVGIEKVSGGFVM
jgi:hypothetical protein